MKVKNLFEPFLKHCALIEENTPKTIEEKRRFLRIIERAIGEKEIECINEYDIAGIKNIAKDYGVFGEQRAVLYFRQLFQYARKQHYPINFDVLEVRIPLVPDKEVEYLNDEEIDKVRACFDLDTIEGLRTRALIEFMLGTALRIGEAVTLNIKDINWETGEFKFINCKTKREEHMTCPEHSMLWLKMYIQKRTDDLPYLFVSGRGRLLGNSSRNYIRQQVKHLNINKKVCHHIWRKTCATKLLLKTDIIAVQNFLRHVDAKTTLKHYTGLTKVQNRKVTSLLTDSFVSRIG